MLQSVGFSRKVEPANPAAAIDKNEARAVVQTVARNRPEFKYFQAQAVQLVHPTCQEMPPVRIRLESFAYAASAAG